MFHIGHFLASGDLPVGKRKFVRQCICKGFKFDLTIRVCLGGNLVLFSRYFDTVKMSCFGGENKAIVCNVVLLDEAEIAIEIKVGSANNCLFVYYRVPSRVELHWINTSRSLRRIVCGLICMIKSLL